MDLVVMMGRLGQEPEIREYGQGKKLASYSIAVDKGRDKEPMWVDCTAFKGAAEFAENNLHKGTKILVMGSLDISDYEKDGIKRKSVKVIVDRHFFCESKNADGAAPFINIPVGIEEDELPFI